MGSRGDNCNTGSGKTQLVRSLAEMINVPVVVCDATALTQTGYVGDDCDSVLQQLYTEAGEDLDVAQRGVVYIDEIDKVHTFPRPMTSSIGQQPHCSALLLEFPMPVLPRHRAAANRPLLPQRGT